MLSPAAWPIAAASLAASAPSSRIASSAVSASRDRGQVVERDRGGRLGRVAGVGRAAVGVAVAAAGSTRRSSRGARPVKARSSRVRACSSVSRPPLTGREQA